MTICMKFVNGRCIYDESMWEIEKGKKVHRKIEKHFLKFLNIFLLFFSMTSNVTKFDLKTSIFAIHLCHSSSSMYVC